MTSMWSETKPIGISTTEVTPSPASFSRWSLTSGSSHDTCGGPEREQNTRSAAICWPVTIATRSATYAGTLGDRSRDGVDHGVEEPGVVVVGAQPVQTGPALARMLGRRGEVLAILPAGRVRRVGAGDEAGSPGDAVGLHRGHGFGEEGLPVAVAPVDGDVHAVVAQVDPDRLQQ